MTPTVSIQTNSKPPSLTELTLTLMNLGSDRGSLVRTVQPGRSPAICVLLMGKARKELAPWLRDLSKTVPNVKEDALVHTAETPIPQIMDWMERLGQTWRWAALSVTVGQGRGKKKLMALAFFFLGPAVNADLAAELTRRGCITNLD
jgi:hypothetical protein